MTLKIISRNFEICNPKRIKIDRVVVVAVVVFRMFKPISVTARLNLHPLKEIQLHKHIRLPRKKNMMIYRGFKAP